MKKVHRNKVEEDIFFVLYDADIYHLLFVEGEGRLPDNSNDTPGYLLTTQLLRKY